MPPTAVRHGSAERVLVVAAEVGLSEENGVGNLARLFASQAHRRNRIIVDVVVFDPCVAADAGSKYASVGGVELRIAEKLPRPGKDSERGSAGEVVEVSDRTEYVLVRSAKAGVVEQDQVMKPVGHLNAASCAVPVHQHSHDDQLRATVLACQVQPCTSADNGRRRSSSSGLTSWTDI